MDNFEKEIADVCCINGYIDAISKQIVQKKFKYKRWSLITDHDVVTYLESSDKYIIVEIQCKNKIEYENSMFGTLDNLKSLVGFFTLNTYKKDKAPAFKIIEYTNNFTYLDWNTKFKNIENDTNSKCPINQIIRSSIHTIDCFDKYNIKNKKNKKIMIFPIICISSLKIDSLLYTTSLKESIFAQHSFKAYIKDTWNVTDSNLNSTGSIQLIICNKKGLEKIIVDLKEYKDKISLTDELQLNK